MFGTLLFGSTLDAPYAPAPPGVPFEALIAAPAALPPAAPVVGPTPTGLSALGFLVGGVWVTTAGQATVAERVTWDPLHTFLLSEVTQSLAGKPAGLGRGYFGYAPALQCLLSSALATSGTYTGGYETASPDSNTWVFAMICGLGAQIQNVQVTMQHPSADQLVIAQAIQQGGVWVPRSSATYWRQLAPL